MFSDTSKYAEGGNRTRTPRGATPSRWCVCQFHHFGEVQNFFELTSFPALSVVPECFAVAGLARAVVGPARAFAAAVAGQVVWRLRESQTSHRAARSESSAQAK